RVASYGRERRPGEPPCPSEGQNLPLHARSCPIPCGISFAFPQVFGGSSPPFRTYAAAGIASLFWLELLTIVLDRNDRTVVRPLATQGAGRRPRTSNRTSSSTSSGRVAGGDACPGSVWWTST